MDLNSFSVDAYSADAWEFFDLVEPQPEAPAAPVEQISYSPTRKRINRDKRLGGQYVQLTPAAKPVEAKPIPAETIEAKQQDIQQEAKRLDALLLEVEQQLAIQAANAQAFDALQEQLRAIQAQQAALKAEQDSLLMLAAYEALMRRIDEQDIEMLLLAL